MCGLFAMPSTGPTPPPEWAVLCIVQFRALFYDDCPLHVRMQRTEILIGSRLREGERECLFGIHNLGAERFVAGNDRVGNIVSIGPGECSARSNGDLCRRKAEIVDMYGRS